MFNVPVQFNKPMIQSYLEQLYSVRVLNVKTVNFLGKRKRFGSFITRTPHYKKAFVTLEQPFEYKYDHIERCPSLLLSRDPKPWDEEFKAKRRGDQKDKKLDNA